MVRTPARCHKVVRLIPVRNIYWMLAYAFRALEKGAYERLGSEEFGNAQELCAAILARGVESQVKRGLGRGYVPQTEALSYVRGKIDVSASLKTNSLLKRRLVCSYDEFSTDTPANRIVKATMQVLLRSRDVSSVYKRGLRRLMPYLAEVGECDLHRCDWNVRIGRNNQDYRLQALRALYLGILSPRAPAAFCQCIAGALGTRRWLYWRAPRYADRYHAAPGRPRAHHRR